MKNTFGGAFVESLAQRNWIIGTIHPFDPLLRQFHSENLINLSVEKVRTNGTIDPLIRHFRSHSLIKLSNKNFRRNGAIHPSIKPSRADNEIDQSNDQFRSNGVIHPSIDKFRLHSKVRQINIRQGNSQKRAVNGANVFRFYHLDQGSSVNGKKHRVKCPLFLIFLQIQNHAADYRAGVSLGSAVHESSTGAPRSAPIHHNLEEISKVELHQASGHLNDPIRLTIDFNCGAHDFIGKNLASIALHKEFKRQIILNLTLLRGFGAKSLARRGNCARGRNGSRGGDRSFHGDGSRSRELALSVNRMWPRAVHAKDHGPREQRGSGFVQVLLDQVLDLLLQVCGVIETRELKTLQRRNRCLQEKIVWQIVAARHEPPLGFILLYELGRYIYRTVIIHVNIPCGNPPSLPSAVEVYGSIS